MRLIMWISWRHRPLFTMRPERDILSFVEDWLRKARIRHIWMHRTRQPLTMPRSRGTMILLISWIRKSVDRRMYLCHSRWKCPLNAKSPNKPINNATRKKKYPQLPHQFPEPPTKLFSWTKKVKLVISLNKKSVILSKTTPPSKTISPTPTASRPNNWTRCNAPNPGKKWPQSACNH